MKITIELDDDLCYSVEMSDDVKRSQFIESFQPLLDCIWYETVYLEEREVEGPN